MKGSSQMSSFGECELDFILGFIVLFIHEINNSLNNVILALEEEARLMRVNTSEFNMSIQT